MTLDEFIKKYDGKYVEAGGSENAKYQCVDLVNQYIEEVLKLPKILWTNACDFPKKADKNQWLWISNTPEGVPNKGDIVVWNKNAGSGYGHVAIFLEGNVKSFRSFDQNWPVGTPAHIQGHYYTNVDGWLRPKGGVMTYYQGIDLTNIESVKVCVDTWKDVVDGKYVKKEEYEKKVNELLETIKAKEKRVEEEALRYQDFLLKLAELLSCSNQEPAVVEEITRLVAVEDRLREMEKKLAEADEKIKQMEKEEQTSIAIKHSKICQWLAKRGL